MTDHDDKVRRRYRELAREEPSADLDTAILAASRRAVARPSAASRWGPPLSIAAVLMLAVGITLNVQREQPGVEYLEPARPGAPPAATAPQPAAPVPQLAPVERLGREDAQPALREKKAIAPPERSREDHFAPSPPAKNAATRAEPAMEEKPAAVKKDAGLSDLAAERASPRAFSAPELASPAPPAAAGARPAASSVPPAAVSAPAGAPLAKTRDAAEARQAAPVQAPAAEPARAKREADAMGANNLRGQALILDPTLELEPIARLRAEGRHAEADKALEEFRRRHPGFRIPEAMWERVKPPSSPPPSPKGEGEPPPR